MQPWRLQGRSCGPWEHRPAGLGSKTGNHHQKGPALREGGQILCGRLAQGELGHVLVRLSGRWERGSNWARPSAQGRGFFMVRGRGFFFMRICDRDNFSQREQAAGTVCNHERSMPADRPRPRRPPGPQPGLRFAELSAWGRRLGPQLASGQGSMVLAPIIFPANTIKKV